MTRLGRLWRERRAAVLAFSVALALALVFATRALLSWHVWSDPARRDPALAGWMTPGYVAHAWRVDREVIADALGIEPGEARGLTLQEIAARRGVPVSEIEAALADAIAAARGAP